MTRCVAPPRKGLTLKSLLNYLDSMSDVFRAIADPTRREILDSLAGKEVSVSEIAKAFSMSLPAVSQHLKVLQDAQLIAGHREGRHIFYRLTPAPLRTIARWINPYERFWQARLDDLDEHLRRRHGRHHS
jgi:DNA-binding transcriptional ArsR family regulator